MIATFTDEDDLLALDGDTAGYLARVVHTIAERDGTQPGEVLRKLESMLAAKNKAYGNSALEPKRVFSKASPSEGIRVRIDDKISRIVNLGFSASEAEDTMMDLAGYLVLLTIAEQQ